MNLRNMGLDSPILSILVNMLDFGRGTQFIQSIRRRRQCPKPWLEYPNSYVFRVEMPGIKASEIKVQVENDNVLFVSGQRKRDKERERETENTDGVNFMRKFALPENTNMDKKSAISQDGVLAVTTEKLPPPEPKRAKTIEVEVA